MTRPTRRHVIVALGVTLLGAAAGAVAAGGVLACAVLAGPAPTASRLLEAMAIGARPGAFVGALAAHALAWSVLRRVPLVVATGTLVTATIGGAAIGGLFAPGWTVAGALVTLMLAARALTRRYPVTTVASGTHPAA